MDECKPLVLGHGASGSPSGSRFFAWLVAQSGVSREVFSANSSLLLSALGSAEVRAGAYTRPLFGST